MMHQLLSATRIKASTQIARKTNRELWLSDDHGAYGNGRLVLRVSVSGVQRFYYRPPRGQGHSSKAIPLGLYSRTQRNGYLTLSQARNRAFNLASNVAFPKDQSSVPSLTRPINQTSFSLMRKVGQDRPLPIAEATSNLSLIEMCRTYAQSLEDDGKASAKEVKQLVERLIAPSELAMQSAREIKSTAFTGLLRSVIEVAKGRTAGKVRSILHTAYARAMNAKLNPSATASQIDYGIESNPITCIDTLAQYQKPRHRFLKDAELREVWRHLQPVESLTIPLRGLRLSMLLGGQRSEQLVSVTIDRVDLEAETILLFDGKGRRKTARPHLLPLCALAKADVQWLMNFAKSTQSKYLLPGSRQGTGLNSGSVSKEVLKIRREMETSGLCLVHFSFIDFRRTIETKLASMKVSKDHRAQLQSHGLSGIQNKHYDMYEYMQEKRDVLILWEQYLNTLIESVGS